MVLLTVDYNRPLIWRIVPFDRYTFVWLQHGIAVTLLEFQSQMINHQCVRWLFYQLNSIHFSHKWILIIAICWAMLTMHWCFERNWFQYRLFHMDHKFQPIQDIYWLQPIDRHPEQAFVHPIHAPSIPTIMH